MVPCRGIVDLFAERVALELALFHLVMGLVLRAAIAFQIWGIR